MPKRKRRETMDDGCRYWIVKYARSNYWRVASWYELDDLIQDGYLHWYRCVRKYPRVSDARLMALFMRTYVGWIDTLSTKRTREANGKWQVELRSYAVSPPSLAIAKAPTQIQKLIAALSSDEGCKEYQADYPVIDSHRETTNERLCRVAGVELTDLRGMIRKQIAQIEG